MRFETHRASAYLVEKIAATGAKITHDGGDILLIERADEKISLHLIESYLPVYEIKRILKQNQRDRIATLFILWSEIMLPYDGQWYIPDDWMTALLGLHSGKIYGYALYGSEVFIYPVYFDDYGKPARQVRYGETIERAFLECSTIHTPIIDLLIHWYVANFTPTPVYQWESQTAKSKLDKPSQTQLQGFYAVLKVPHNADKITIKRAFRLLARQYHPDLNPSPEATAHMQRINEAYTYIMQQFSDD